LRHAIPVCIFSNLDSWGFFFEYKSSVRGNPLPSITCSALATVLKWWFTVPKSSACSFTITSPHTTISSIIYNGGLWPGYLTCSCVADNQPIALIAMYPQASGVETSPEVLTEYLGVKTRRTARYIIFKISNDMKSIIVDKKVSDDSYETFLGDLPETECRWAVYDFEYESGDGKRNKLVFYSW
jgi:hypothetical protein